MLDPETTVYLRRECDRLASEAVHGLATGNFYENGTFSVGKYERQRGIIEGIGLCLNLLEPQPLPETPSESEDHGTDAA